MKGTNRIEVKPVDQSFESLNSEVIYFLLCAVFSMLKVFHFCHYVLIRSVSRVFCLAFDLKQYEMIYSLFH